MREHLLDALRALADTEYQKCVWIDRVLSHDGYYDELALEIHILHDDLILGSGAASSVGSILLDQREARAVGGVIAAMDALLADHGTNLDERVAIASPRWPDVVCAAMTALTEMG
ncbi:MAG: hypothetical protein PVSMB7_13620 [Chloroflexota bacterium]